MSSWLRHLVTAMVAAVLVWLGTPTASALPIVPAPALAHDYDAALNGGQVVENAMERGPPGISYHYNLAHPAVGSAAHGNSQRASDPLAPDTYGYDPDTRLAQVDHSADTTTNAPGAAGVALSSLQPDLVAANTGARALPSFPKALSGGPADTHVYLGIRDGKNVYAGITNNLGRRQAQHGDRFALDPITTSPVTRGEARAIEQALIVRNGAGFENKINSISPSHSYYDDAVGWGEAWLKQNGIR